MIARALVLLSFAAFAVLGCHPAWSQDWPQRPVRIIVPYAPGGNTDGIARIVAQRLGEAFGHQFIVDNRPGAGGALAAEAVARSPADGYTLFVSAMAIMAIVPVLSKVTYDPKKDFAPISNVGSNPQVLAVNPSFPAATLAEFVSHVRANPQKITYAAGNIGSLAHLSMALFMKRAGLEMIAVPYKGGGMAPLTDVIAGHVPMYFAPLSDVVPHRSSGKIRMLAVSNLQRVPQLPDVPTFDESGYAGFKTQTWNGVLAPAGTPKPIIDRIAQEVARATRDPKVIERLASFGVTPLGNSPDEFAAQLDADIALWADAIKLAGL